MLALENSLNRFVMHPMQWLDLAAQREKFPSNALVSIAAAQDSFVLAWHHLVHANVQGEKNKIKNTQKHYIYVWVCPGGFWHFSYVNNCRNLVKETPTIVLASNFIAGVISHIKSNIYFMIR